MPPKRSEFDSPPEWYKEAARLHHEGVPTTHIVKQLTAKPAPSDQTVRRLLILYGDWVSTPRTRKTAEKAKEPAWLPALCDMARERPSLPMTAYQDLASRIAGRLELKAPSVSTVSKWLKRKGWGQRNLS